MKLYEHQKNALNETKEQNKVAYYHDMGLGKTFTGSEKLMQLNEKINLIVCQKSKINDWYDHFMKYYKNKILIFDLTDENHLKWFLEETIISLSHQARKSKYYNNYHHIGLAYISKESPL